jgi:hypothetical protein
MISLLVFPKDFEYKINDFLAHGDTGSVLPKSGKPASEMSARHQADNAPFVEIWK